MDNLQSHQESWDFRKIFLLIFILGVAIFGLKTFVLDRNFQTQTSPAATVEGTSTKETLKPQDVIPKQQIQKSVEEKLTEIRKEINTINVIEIATSTPAVQKVLNDFKNLQDLPQNEAKKACFKICEGIQ